METIVIDREILLNGRWQVDTVSNQLVDLQGESVATVLSPVALRLLTLLAGSPNTVIERRKLFDEGWRRFGFEVCDNSLNQVIHTLREVFAHLCADAPGIKTVPRIGYCLMARVTMREAGKATGEIITTGEAANRQLLARPVFDDALEREWGRAQRDAQRLLSLLLIRFATDEAAGGTIERGILRQIHRAGDAATCYTSGEVSTEYAVLLPSTDRQGAACVARRIQAVTNGRALAIGLACTDGDDLATPYGLVDAARAASCGAPDSAVASPELCLAA
ncbi:winged helix-turn-helix domain-containing protein [Paraburkholderia heleia]|uniref:winged helix-turn-helix domain-containing protein n=1 Tax=Paraburkholderia heleia TaxID=634127 RepID=UPI002AB751BE|nr:winged helix-turn-helix domain-containing protein [Paraburkholderia heleia]